LELVNDGILLTKPRLFQQWSKIFSLHVLCVNLLCMSLCFVLWLLHILQGLWWILFVISHLFLWIVVSICIFIFVLQYYARTKLVMRLGTCKVFNPWKALDLDFSLRRRLFWWGINALGVVGAHVAKSHLTCKWVDNLCLLWWKCF